MKASENVMVHVFIVYFLIAILGLVMFAAVANIHDSHRPAFRKSPPPENSKEMPTRLAHFYSSKWEGK